MNLEKFIEKFVLAFEMTEISEINADTKFKEIEEWDSLTALSVIGIIKNEFNVTISGTELKQLTTVNDLFNLVLARI